MHVHVFLLLRTLTLTLTSNLPFPLPIPSVTLIVLVYTRGSSVIYSQKSKSVSSLFYFGITYHTARLTYDVTYGAKITGIYPTA